MTYVCVCVCACCCYAVFQSCPTLLRPHRLKPARLLCPWDFPSKNMGVGCHFLLQEIFPTQGMNPSFLHWQANSLPLSHQGSPCVCVCVCVCIYLHIYINTYIYSYMEKAMAPHSSTLAWNIPWMEEPGRLQSMGLQRVRYD